MKIRSRAVLALGTVLALTAMSGSATAAIPKKVIAYNSIPNNLPGNVLSQPFQAQQTSEFGDEVILAGTATHLSRVRVIMSSWGCESGGWNTNDCLTSPGAVFTMPITLHIYAGSGGPTPGALLASQTRTFNIRYRPSANGVKCTGLDLGKWWSKKGHACYRGYAQGITFAFPSKLRSARITLPSQVIWTVAFNTTTWGYNPQGTQPCSSSPGGCGYDSLNVGIETFAGQPSKGTDVDPDGAYINSATDDVYCDGGAGGTGFLRLDTGCWSGYTPLANIRMV